MALLTASAPARAEGTGAGDQRVVLAAFAAAAAAVAVFSSAFFPVALFPSVPSAPPAAHAARSVAAIPETLRQAINKELGPGPITLPGADGEHFVPTRSGWKIASHGMAATVGTQGVVTVSSGSTTASLGPRSLSYPNTAPQILRVSATSISGSRLVQSMGPVSTWCRLSAAGIEQGFTVEAPPAVGHRSEATSALGGQLFFDLGPAHRWQVGGGGTSLILAGRTGAPSLTFADLTATDASGRALPALLATRHGQAGIAIETTSSTAYPITIDPTWTTSTSPTATLTKSGSAAGDSDGSVVALSADGTVALVGGSGAASTKGQLYVFTASSPGSWSSSSAPVVISDPANTAGDFFGTAVAISPDGKMAAVGSNAGTGGTMYVYTATSESAWGSATLQKTITDPAATAGDLFGAALSISSDGSTLLSGSPASIVTAGPTPGPGKAYVYQAANEGSWGTGVLVATLSNSSGAAGDNFGVTVGLSGDGTTAIVGASLAAAGDGAAYVYHVASETSWATSTSPTVTLSDPTATALDKFGLDVSISSDSTTALVGALGTKVGGHAAQGEAYVFQAASASTWGSVTTPKANLTNSSGSAGDDLGDSVALSPDGTTAAVGAGGFNAGGASGVAYIYSASSETSWATAGSPTATLSNASGSGGDSFGSALAVSSSSEPPSNAPDSTVLVGAPGFSAGASNGAAYVFVAPASATVPGAPTGLGATAGNGQVSLSWSAPASNGGSAITGYNVFQGTSAGGESATAISGSPFSGTSTTVTGLTNGTTFFFTVKAVNSVGNSAASSEVSASPVAPPAPVTSSTSTTLSAQQTTVTPGGPVTLAVTVTSSAGAPQGTVTISAGASPLSGCAGLPLGGSTAPPTATCTTSFTSPGQVTVTATYNGSRYFQTSTSSPLVITVANPQPTLTTTTLTASSSSGSPATTLTVAPGTPVTLTAMVTASSGTAAPTGTVAFDQSTTAGSIGTPITGCASATLVATPVSTSKGTPASATATCTFTLFAGGTYTLTAGFNGTSLYVASSSAPVTVTVAPPGPAAYVANFGDNTVTPISLATNQPGSAINVGNGPSAIAITPDGKTAIVGNKTDNAVTRINLATNQPVTTIKVGNGPSAIAITPDGTTAIVANSVDGTVTRINLAMNQPVTTIKVGNGPSAIAITPDGTTAYVANSVDGTVTRINLAMNQAVTTIKVGTRPAAVAITPDGKTAYVANFDDNTITPITLATNQSGSAIGAGTFPAAIAITPDGKTAYVADVGVEGVTPITLATNQSGSAIRVGEDPFAIAITPDGTTAYVANYVDSTVTPITLATNQAGNPIAVGTHPDAIAITPAPQPLVPTVTGISPSSGSAAGGTTVTVTGTGFSRSTTVDFGSVAAPHFTVNSAGTQITTTSPTCISPCTPVDVTVTAPGGTSTTYATDLFTYLQSSITKVSGASKNLSCPSVDFCAMTDSNNQIWYSTDPGASVPSWTKTSDSATALSCAATSTKDLCAFTDGKNQIWTVNFSTSSPSATNTGGFAVDISCAATSTSALCAFTDGSHQIWTFDPGASSPTFTNTGGFAVGIWCAPATSKVICAFTDGNNQLWTYASGGFTNTGTFLSGPPTGLACPTDSFCVALSGNGSVAPFNPSATTNSAPTSIDNSRSLSAVSCSANPSGSRCLTIDGAGNAITSSNPAAGASAWSSAINITNSANLNAVSCPTTGFCVAIAGTGNVVAYVFPIVTGVIPVNGTPAGGTAVTITGSELAGATSVAFCKAGSANSASGCAPGTAITANSETSVTVTSPSGSSTVDVVVTTPIGTSATSASDQYSYGCSPGLFLASANGQVSSLASAKNFGSPVQLDPSKPAGGSNAITLAASIVGITATCDNGGYWMVGSDGGIFAFGDAKYHGSTGQLDPTKAAGGKNAVTLAAPIVGIAATPDGGGYWMVASDGGVFAFGDAKYRGSISQLDPSKPAGGSNAASLVRPIIGIVATSDGKGYWLDGSDGSVYAFSAPYHGSVGFPSPPGLGLHIFNFVGMAATPDGKGYWLVQSNGGIFSFSATYFGSLPQKGVAVSNIVAGVSTNDGKGYWIVGTDGTIYNFGDAGAITGPTGTSPIVGAAG